MKLNVIVHIDIYTVQTTQIMMARWLILCMKIKLHLRNKIQLLQPAEAALRQYNACMIIKCSTDLIHLYIEQTDLYRPLKIKSFTHESVNNTEHLTVFSREGERELASGTRPDKPSV